MNNDLSVRAKYILESIFIILSMFMLMIISLYIPIIGVLFIPILIVLLCLRHSNKIAIPLISISILIPSIIFGSILSLMSGVTYIIIGIILTICINKNIKFINSFCILSLVVFISNIVNLVVTIYIVNKSNFWGFAQSIVKNFNEVMKVYSDIGIDVSTSQYTQSISKIMTPQNILSAVPTIIIIFSIIIAFLIYFVAEKVLIKNGYKINKITNFDKWYLEPKIGAILIIITCLSMILYSNNIVIAEYIYKTTYALFQLLMMVIGLSVINYFFQNKIKINKNFSTGISILVLISPLNILLPILGLVDLVSDIRGIDPNSLGTALRKKLSL